MLGHSFKKKKMLSHLLSCHRYLIISVMLQIS